MRNFAGVKRLLGYPVQFLLFCYAVIHSMFEPLHEPPFCMPQQKHMKDYIVHEGWQDSSLVCVFAYELPRLI